MTESSTRIFFIDRQIAALVCGNEEFGGSSIRLIDQEGQMAHGRQFAETALQQRSLEENVYARLPQEPGE